MSGITPILDTLLHQVLGRRPAPPRQGSDTPLQPAQPGRPSQPARSDSRLNAGPVLADNAAGVIARSATGKGLSAPPLTGDPPVMTHLSPAAREIAAILARFPAPPSAIRPALPLLDAALLLTSSSSPSPASPVNAAPSSAQSSAPLPSSLSAQLSAQLANVAPLPGAASNESAMLALQLQNSIQGSGLFYEAHLRRWLSGRFERADLAREPQMRLAGNTPALHLDVQAVVRHQLEMLAAPVLRWEGEPWAGILMALTLYPPVHERGSRQSSGDDRRQEAPPWQSRLTLRLAHLGELSVRLQLSAQRVAIDLQAQPAMVARFEAGSGMLRERLTTLGFQQVTLRIRALANEAADETTEGTAGADEHG